MQSPLFLVGVPAGLPELNCCEQLVSFRASRPDGFFKFESNLVLAFADALVIAAEMRKVGDPDDTIERYVLVVDVTEYRSHDLYSPVHVSEFRGSPRG